MEIAATGATQAQAASPGPAAATKAAPASDFETFLRMLTVQLQNQDPLNPTDPSDYAVQLATFSGVEQQVRTNELLDTLAAGLGALQMGDLAGWIGMEAESAAAIGFDGSPVDLTLPAIPGAEAAELVVTDPAGREVQRLPVSPDGGTYRWDGEVPGAGLLLNGHYALNVEGRRGGELHGSSPVTRFAEVVQAHTGPEGITLTLADGAEVPAAEVTALRRPAA